MNRWIGVALATAALGAPAVAQTAPIDSTVVTGRDLFHRSDLYVAAGFAAATIAMFPLDRHLASEARREDYLGSTSLRRAATVMRYIGGPGSTIITGGGYLVGRLAGQRRLAEVSLHTAEALVVATATTWTLKGVIGRERPYVSADTNPRRFSPFRGWKAGDAASFPSGHTTAAFAMAAALVAEVGDKWPRQQKIVAPVAFIVATGVGLSRMYDDKHWASDVVMGAAIGTFAGLKIVRFNHTRAGNRVDRWLLGERATLSIDPRPHGAVVTWSRR